MDLIHCMCSGLTISWVNSLFYRVNQVEERLDRLERCVIIQVDEPTEDGTLPEDTTNKKNK